MVAAGVTNEEVAAAWQRLGGRVDLVAQCFGVNRRTAQRWRVRAEDALGIKLVASVDQTNRSHVSLPKQGFRHTLTVTSSIVPVFGDAHFWPSDDRTASYLALLEIIKEFKPQIVVDNGDSFDGARISSHPPVGWMNMPEVADELDFCKERLGEIEATARVARPDVVLVKNMGNHDSRFSARLAQSAPDYVRVHGTDLKDHLPAWGIGWSTLINDHTMIKHRLKGGVHATWNNTLHAGKNMVTNHLHQLKVTPLTDYNGRRWGVDCGTISEFGPTEDKFSYAEDAPLNWGEGFAVLTFDERGRLLPPELCEVIDGKAYFRGAVIASKPTKRKRAA